MTATPRILSENIKTRLGSKAEDLLYDMSDEKVFGEEIYRMSFGDAIKLGILVDYKILGVGVTDKEIAQYLKQKKFVTSKLTIQDYANNYALDLVMSKYNANHAISFHSKVSYANQFSQRHKKIINDIYSESVSGEQSTARRSVILNEFKNRDKGLISNARCLTEGVDIPIIDLVYFADPKNSKVDIVQAAGRALRINKKSDKKIGYIVVPIFHHKNKSIDEAIDEGVFRNLVNVVRSLSDQDERLQIEINKLAFKKNRKTSFGNNSDFVFNESKENVIELFGFERKLRDSLYDQVIEKVATNWGAKYELLKLWREVYSDNWPKQIRPDRREEETPAIIEENSLGVWLLGIRQKYRDGKLSNFWIKQFNELSFPWDYREMQSELIYEKISQYLNEKKRFPTSSENAKLRTYFINKITDYEENRISENLRNLLNKYNFKKFIMESKYQKSWGDWYNDIILFKQTHNKLPYNDSHQKDQDKIAKSLGNWLNRQKQDYKNSILTKKQICDLKIIGVGFQNFDKIWDKRLKDVKVFYAKHNRWPKENSKIREEQLLGHWLLNNRNWYRGNLKKYGLYSEERRLKLANIGYNLEGSGISRKKIGWEAQFDYLENFRLLNPNRWPVHNEQFPEGCRLGAWCATQRQNYKKNILSEFRIKMLESIGFNFTILEMDVKKTWEENFEMYQQLIENKQFITYKENTQSYRWSMRQRENYKKDLLDTNQITMLKTLNILD